MAQVFLQCLLVFAMACSCHSKMRFCSGVHEMFNDESHMCCGHQLQRKQPGKGCCGGKLYETDSAMCCLDKLFNITDTSEHHECCGGEMIRDDRICCNGKPMALTNEEKEKRDSLMCCDIGIVADKYKKFCCGRVPLSRGRAHQCCANEIIDDTVYYCKQTVAGERKLLLSEELCGGVVYRTDEDTCCYGKLHAGAKLSCCAAEAYDGRKEFCCDPRYNPHVIPKKPDLGCCGDGFYNKTSQWCVQNSAITKKVKDALCGNHVYDPSRHSCCADTLSYDPATHQCCQGPTSTIAPLDMACCNGRSWNQTDELCCYGSEPCKKSSPDDDECCMVNDHWQTFCTKKNQQCHQGLINEVQAGRELCGEDHTIYDPEEVICCLGTTALKSDGFRECCGAKPYDPDTQSCCFGYMVYDVPSHRGSCCEKDGRAYYFNDPSNPCGRKIDCNGRLHDVDASGRDLECCGRRLIDSEQSGCCGGKAYKLGQSAACCADLQALNPKYFQCRPTERGVVVPADGPKTDTQRMCSKYGFRNSDLLVQHTCTRRYATIAKVKSVRFRKSGPSKIKVTLRLANVTSPRRECRETRSSTGDYRDNLTPETEDDQVVLKRQTVRITIKESSDVRCIKQKFDWLKKKMVIILYDKELRSKVIIKKRNALYITRLNSRNYRTLTRTNSKTCKSMNL